MLGATTSDSPNGSRLVIAVIRAANRARCAATPPLCLPFTTTLALSRSAGVGEPDMLAVLEVLGTSFSVSLQPAGVV